MPPRGEGPSVPGTNGPLGRWSASGRLLLRRRHDTRASPDLILHVPLLSDEPVRGAFPYLEHPGILSLSGLEQIRRFSERRLPFGPLWYLTGLDLVDFGPGTATYRLPMTGWLRSGAGLITGGALAFAADGALGSSIFTTLGPGRVLATSDLALNFLRPPAEGCDAIIARGRLIQAGRSQGLSEATVEDPNGHLLAHATSRCVISDVGGPLSDPPQDPVPWPEYPGPHPFERPPVGDVVPQDVWDRMDGIEVMRAWQRGELQRTPLSNLLGAEVRRVEEGAVTLTMPASPWFGGMSGAFYGGALALFADYGIHGAVNSTVPARTSWATLDLRVRFLRPVMPDRRPLEVRARVAHRGRRIAVVSAQVLTAERTVAAMADASVMLLPDRPWSHSTATIDEAFAARGRAE